MVFPSSNTLFSAADWEDADVDAAASEEEGVSSFDWVVEDKIEETEDRSEEGAGEGEESQPTRDTTKIAQNKKHAAFCSLFFIYAHHIFI